MRQTADLIEELQADAPVARGLIDREDLLERLDRAVAKRVTVISAPPGSGKTSLLRAWAERAAGHRRVAFVSVERDQQDAQRFWSAGQRSRDEYGVWRVSRRVAQLMIINEGGCRLTLRRARVSTRAVCHWEP